LLLEGIVAREVISYARSLAAMTRPAALALALVSIGGGARAGRAEPACAAPVPTYAAGRRVSSVCPDQAASLHLTLVDLSEDYVPRALRAEPGTALPYATVYRELAAGGDEHPPGIADRYLELWGIFPGFSVLRGRLGDEERHVCHDRVDDGALTAYDRPLVEDGRTAAAERGAPLRRDAVRALQLHLACDGLLALDAVDERFGPRTAEALTAFRRRHMVARAGGLDQELRELIVTDTRELDFRAVLRALRERVVDATGLVEDGSARGEWRPVLERYLEPAGLRDLAGHAPLAGGAADLVSPATEAAARALGWTDPAAALASLEQIARDGTRQVALALPPPPRYHGPAMELRAEIDRGDVWYDYPWTASGTRRAQPRERRPVLTLYARDGAGEVALLRWPTTIGTWQREKLAGGAVVTRYKPSTPGESMWREIVAAPVWFAPPTTPDRELVRRTATGWRAREDTIGPGHRSAYGLVMIMHRNRAGGDTGVRTHGTADYLSVSQGNGSHGCHRLLSYQALRLAGFLLTHRAFTTRGQLSESYGRRLHWAGKTIAVRRGTRGYVRELDPPVEVRVLPGRILGRAQRPISRFF
jgi:hypothetical protein